MNAVYLVIAHGSREEESNKAFFDFLAKFQTIVPNRVVEGAFLEIAKPSIPEAIERAVAKGIQEFFVLPLMVFPGKHVKKHIPQFLQEAKAQYPEIDFHYAGFLADHPMMLQLLKGKAEGLAPSNLHRSSRRPSNGRLPKRSRPSRRGVKV